LPVAVTSRFNYNLGYFQGNYLMIFLIVAAYTLYVSSGLVDTFVILALNLTSGTPWMETSR
jgi:hypothetical protein